MIRRVGLAVLVGAVVAACAPPPPKQPDPTIAQVTITAADDANPDPSGRASPAVVPLTAVLGLLAWRHFFALTALAFMLNVLISVGSILAANWSERSRLATSPSARLFAYDRPRDLLRLALAAVNENVVYRQVLLYWRLRGTWDFLRAKRGWDKFKRKGFAS